MSWASCGSTAGLFLTPTPIVVFVEVYELAREGSLFPDIAKTLTRAAIAFVVAMFVGIVIGSALGRFRSLDGLFGNWILIGLNIPAIVVAITFYIWFGLTEFALIIAVVVNKAPLVSVAPTVSEEATHESFAVKSTAVLCCRIWRWR